MTLRFHTQTGGSTLTAQQPENNVVRVTLQALAAVLGGTPDPAHQQLRRGARAADRARGQARAAHPAGHRLRVGRRPTRSTRSAGSYYVESLTDEIERRATGYLERDRRARRRRRRHRGGLHAGRDRGAAYADAPSVDEHRRDRRGRQPVRRRRGVARRRLPRRRRRSRPPVGAGRQAAGAAASGDGVAAALADLEAAARGPRTCSSRCASALKLRATLGEVADVLRERVRRLPVPGALSAGTAGRRSPEATRRSAASVATSMPVRRERHRSAVDHGAVGRRRRARRGELGLVVDGSRARRCRAVGWIDGTASETFAMSVEIVGIGRAVVVGGEDPAERLGVAAVARRGAAVGPRTCASRGALGDLEGARPWRARRPRSRHRRARRSVVEARRESRPRT